MKNIDYYSVVKTPYKSKKYFIDKELSKLETFVGTKKEIEKKEKELMEKANENFRKHFSKRQNEQNKKIIEFKNDLAIEYGVDGNPKLDLVWEKAWSHGHSSGLGDVKYYFEDLIDLII